MFLFSLVETNWGLDSHTNFVDFFSSVLTLFRVSTGEDWQNIMYACADTERGGTVLAYPFFIVFVATANFMVLNLFVMIISENFEEESLMRALETFSRADLERYKSTWSKYDPKGYKFIPISD